jgi:hypothetical protein
VAGGKLSSVLNFGAKLAPSFKRTEAEVERRSASLGKSIGKLQQKQKALARELNKAPAGEARDRLVKQYRAVSAAAEKAEQRIAGMRREKERLERGRARLASIFEGARDAAGSFARTGLAAIATAARATAVGAAAAVGGIVAMTHSAASHGAELAALSRRTGLSTRQLQAFGHAASQTGVELDTVVDATKTLQEKIAEAVRDPRGSAREMFNRLDLSASALTSMHPDEQLGFIADALQGVTNQAERTRIATELLGGSGDRLLPMLEGGSEGLRRMRDEAERLGVSLDDGAIAASVEYTASLRELQGRFVGIRNQIATRVLPVLTRLIERFGSWLATVDVQAFASKVGSAFERIGQVLETHGPRMLALAERFGGFLVDAVPPAIDLAEKVASLVGSIGGAETAITGLGAAWAAAFGVSAIAKVVAVGRAVGELAGLIRGAGTAAAALQSAAPAAGAAPAGASLAGRALPVAALGALFTGAVRESAGWGATADESDFGRARSAANRRMWRAIGDPFGLGDFHEDDTRRMGAKRDDFGGAAVSEAVRPELLESVAEATRSSEETTVNDSRTFTSNITINAVPGEDAQSLASDVVGRQNRSFEAMESGSYSGG